MGTLAQNIGSNVSCSNTKTWRLSVYEFRLLFHEWTLEPCLSVGIRIPSLLLHGQGRLGEKRLEPGRQMGPYVINLVSELAAAPGTILVGFIDQNLNTRLSSLQKNCSFNHLSFLDGIEFLSSYCALKGPIENCFGNDKKQI